MFYNSVSIGIKNVSKEYKIYDRPFDRLRAMLPWNKNNNKGKSFFAIDNISFDIKQGDVVGIVGRNGAGKSTLLQIIAGTIFPTQGESYTSGKVAALLELGSGFNLEFTGRENIYFSAAIAGMSANEIKKQYDSIVEFSGIEEFINQPVKNYSSGMLMRLAFAVATTTEPDILIIDEALSVGDGAFARKSFDRIMKLKEQGCTILFCSHSLFQIESLCSRAIWIEGGKVCADGNAANVVSQYQSFLNKIDTEPTKQILKPAAIHGYAKLIHVSVEIDNNVQQPLKGISKKSTLSIYGKFSSDIKLPCPSTAVTISSDDGRILSSAGAWNDDVELLRDSSGEGEFAIHFPAIRLLKGKYNVGVYLFCEKGLHTYDWADPIAIIELTQEGIEQGIISLEHQWENENDKQ